VQKDTFRDIAGILVQYRRHRVWRKIVWLLSCIVVFCTTYALILPAITMEKTPQCGKPEHNHSEACYTQVTAENRTVPVCTLESLGIHQHTDACKDENGGYLCGHADFVVHEHDAFCYDENGTLWCPLPEIKAHTHDSSCYTQPEPQPVHTHGEGCYIREKGDLICTTPEGAVTHTHSADCYEDTREQICLLEESDGHHHDESCKNEHGELTCGCEESEGHHHSEACYQTVSNLICAVSDQPHQHSDECYAWNDVQTCTLPTDPAEPVTADPVLTCGEKEILLHEHTQKDCYETDKDGNSRLICKETEILEHVHTGSCFQMVDISVDPEALTCGIKEGEGSHIHSQAAGCFDEGGTIVCGLEEYQGHKHTGLCYGTWELICGLEEHIHTEECRALPELTEEEQAQVDAVTAQIEALPSQAEVEERLAAFEKDGGQDGYDAYLAELRAQVMAVSDAYDVLTDAQRARVPNVDRLTALDWLCSLPLEDPALLTIANEDGTPAIVEDWAPEETNDVRKRLNNALVMVDQGYTIQEIRYYKISGLTGTSAVVAYTQGGLSAVDQSQLFVYDLGTDGMALERCITADSQRDTGTNTFTSFSFTPLSGNDSPAHFYAFLSATPATLDEMGIYLGTYNESDNTWVVYDTQAPADASVKATITLPEGTSAPEGYRPFIRMIKEGEGYYPEDDAITGEAGKFNGWQCYTIRWIMQDEQGIHMIPLNMESDTGEGVTVEVRIDYLKPDAQLPGPAGGRKLLIFNSAHDGSLVAQVADLVQNVLVDDTGYTSFTFHAAHSGPYVFVSKALEKGYIENVAIGSIVDGSAPFDLTGDLVNGEVDHPGNDSSECNKVVRSYDTIQYNLAVTFAARQDAVTAPETKMYFELILRKSATAARFAFDKMLWLGDHYGVEYLDANNKVVMVMDHEGGFYEPLTDESGNVVRDESGFALPGANSISFNAQVSGSLAGQDSYKVATGGIVAQRLSGWAIVRPEKGDNVLSGTQTFTAAVEVRNADNGESFSPYFRLWLDGNEENYGPEKAENGALIPAQPVESNQVTADGADAVIVSAGATYNLQLKKNSDMSYKNWFDFSSGNLVTEPDRARLVELANLTANHGQSNPAEFVDENGLPLDPDTKARYENYRYGRLTCYGIALQLYTDTDNNPATNRAAKGLKGISLPVGDITFDLNFQSIVDNGATPADEYTAILWDYNENVPAGTAYSYTYNDPAYPAGDKTYPARGTVTTPNDGLGNGGRNLYWDGESRSPYAKGGAPSWFRKYFDGCYYGGTWELAGGIQDAHPVKVTGSGEDATYHFKVSDYDFDFDTQHFPTQDAGNSGNVPGYDTYARCFSAGCVQVLSVFPMVQEISTVNISLKAEVSNLHLTTRAGQECGKEVTDADNVKVDEIVLYAPGNVTKGNAFNGTSNGKDPYAVNDGFLGTDYWTTSYDCSTFAGDNIWILSYGMMQSGGDYRTRSMNLLQLFDSRALRIRGKADVCQNYDPSYDHPGQPTFLYAIDPDHLDGYDTNKPGILEYMNSVREEDLLYSTSLPDGDGNITAGGMTGKCIGVLMELRGCDLLGGKYQYMRVPVKVNGDDPDLVSKTVATVNALRVWSYDLGDTTWADGKWDENTQKNTLAGYEIPTNKIDGEKYSCELANTAARKLIYTKTEYENGQKTSNSHTGGTLAGNSLLILSYKATVDITVSNKQSESGAFIFYPASGETTVEYKLKNILAQTAPFATGQEDLQLTTLTIRTDLDEMNDPAEDRIHISDGSYRIRGYEPGTKLDADGNPEAEEKEFTISSSSGSPTSLTYLGSDKKMHTIQIYAQHNGSRSVSFVIRNAPVGIQLPDITFLADFGALTVLENNDTFQTGVYISGEGDQRAYATANGNASNVSVGIVVNSGTSLSKLVNLKYIELNGTIQYTVTYTNRGNEQFDAIYFYDLLPNSSDIRGSHFEGDVILRSFGANTNGEGAPPTVTVYYSTKPYTQLYDKVKVFGGTWNESTGNATGMDAGKIDAMLNGDGDYFETLGTVVGGTLVPAPSLPKGDALTELLTQITGLYVKVESLKSNQSVDLVFTIETCGNRAGNFYKNIANSWIKNSPTLPLVSNKVETQVVSRTVSGVVWHDKNLNGIREEDEPLLDGVTATLFKQNEDGSYSPCEEDVTGASISGGICVTGGTDHNGNKLSSGAYSFENLPMGEYIVAFSGDILNNYTSATTYQQSGGNQANTNDGKPIKAAKARNAGKYQYYIQYSRDSSSITLHSIGNMMTVTLNDGVEEYVNQDLGLITAVMELPETGGAGTFLFTFLGLALMAGAPLLLRRQCGV